ncbi:MAG: AIR synthase-related protein, partial [Bdellovibrionota bacterium]
VVEGGKEVTGASVEEGDCIYAFGSSGAHSNGFSLIRAIMKRKKLSYSDSCEFLPSKTWGHVWLKPTEIYVPLILKLQQHLSIKAMAHITGGGILGNLGRVIPDGLCAHVQRQSWKMPAMFQWLQTAGKVPWEDMERTFNLGLGYMIVIKESDESKLTKLGKKVYKVGKIKKGLVRACWD